MKSTKWMSPMLTNVFCLIGLLVLIFSITVFTQSERQRDLLYRRVRSIGYREIRQIKEFLPPLIKVGSEWRFNASNYSNIIVGDCSNIPLGYENEELIGQGYSKKVFRYGNVAVKKPMLKSGKTFNECIQKTDMNEDKCIKLEIEGFITEIGLILQLQSDPIVPKIFAYCIPIDTNELSIIVELGESLDIIKYINLSWNKRLQFVSDVLEFLERIRPLKLMDFRRQQFTIRENQHPMYVDFDSTIMDNINNHTGNSTDLENARKVYDTFANKYLWIGRPAGSLKVLTRLRRQYNKKQLGSKHFQQALTELQQVK